MAPTRSLVSERYFSLKSKNLDIFALDCKLIEYMNDKALVYVALQVKERYLAFCLAGDNGVSSDCDGPPWHNNGVCSDGASGICVPGDGAFSCGFCAFD